LTSNAVRQREEPPTFSGLLRRYRRRIPKEIFICFAHFAWIRELRELNFEHGIHGKGLADRVSPGDVKGDASVNL